MRVAIFAEGPSDAAVLSSILKGKLGVNRSDIDYRVPELDFDDSETIEETESWLLTLYEPTTTETAKYNQPKERFWEHVFPKFSLKDRNFFKNQTAYQQHLALSKGFCKKKTLVDCCKRNMSLKLFCDSLEVFELKYPPQ